MTPGTSRRMSSTPQKQPPASTATSVCCAPATAERVPRSGSVIWNSPVRQWSDTLGDRQQPDSGEVEASKRRCVDDAQYGPVTGGAAQDDAHAVPVLQ